jgi:hypothetical protein
MKVLSVVWPWPWLIIYGGKDVENRSWGTGYRGRLLIHVSKKPDPYWDNILEIVDEHENKQSIISEMEIKMKRLCGCIIGSVELADCVQDSKSYWADSLMWNWILKDPRPCQPVPIKGSLGLWEYTGFYKEQTDGNCGRL